MRTYLQGAAIRTGSRLGISAVLCAAAFAVAPVGARESGHGASRGGGHSVGMHEATWHGGGAHPVRAQWHGGGGGGAGGWHGGGGGGARGWHGGGGGGAGGWHGGGGHWFHGWHGGAYGWWWFNGGLWWPYYAWGYPYWWGYPYPSYYAEPPADAPGSYGAMPAPQQSWFYCEAAGGYYPQVQTCPGGWRQVPAAPPPQAGGPPGPPPGQ